MEYLLDRAWAEINLDNLVYNLDQVKSKINKNTEICGVVKADAYGHGAIHIAKTLIDNGVTRLAVAILDEAIQLRKSGITVPILALTHSNPKRAKELIQYNITQTVFSNDVAEALSNAAISMSSKCKIHIKIDTGLGRTGLMPTHKSVANIFKLSKLPGIDIEGIFTHFSSADDVDRHHTKMQFEQFMYICQELNKASLYIPIKHACNSAGIINFPNMHLDMVRAGIVMYGMYPSLHDIPNKINLRQIMSLKSNVILIKTVPKDYFISYRRTFRTNRPSKIATVHVGYADGYSTLFNHRSTVLINGEIAPTIGRICMDQCMIDITDLENETHIGDEVVLFGRQGESEIKIDEITKSDGLNYEITCNIGKRVPRVYIKDNKIVDIHNYLLD